MLRRGDPPPGLVGADEGVEEGLGSFLLVFGEGGDGLELEPELFTGAALVLLEHQEVGRDPERPGELRESSTSSGRAFGVSRYPATGPKAESDRTGLPELTGTRRTAHSYRPKYYPSRGCDMKITTKGQVTIPAEIRERLGLLPNTEVEFTIRGDAALLKKAGRRTARGRRVIAQLRGRATVRLTTDQILALTRAG